jgi:beta-mannosidase
MDFNPGMGLRLGVQQPGYQDDHWFPVSVPGDVYDAMQSVGRIGPIFYNMNIETCRWIEQQEWWYRNVFSIEEPPKHGEKWILRFDGLDTYCSIYLDGVLLSQCKNMFMDYEFDVTDSIKPGNITLAICFHPLKDLVENKQIEGQWAWDLGNLDRVFVRKAQYQFGWDWAPRLPTVGIWKDVSLLRYTEARIKRFHFKTHRVSAESADVTIDLEVERWTDQTLKARIALKSLEDGSKDQPIVVTLPICDSSLQVDLTIEKPNLWWTRDLGDPFLYQLEIDLLLGETIIDTITHRVGIRTITIDQSPDPNEPHSRYFRFILNDIPIFARGANFVPMDSLPSRIEKERYLSIIHRAVEANMNCLRVWGGGFYEAEVFYDLCDEFGILVWQDFMFACALYPADDQDFIKLVQAEAEQVIYRLRNHPCVALWCGNNEIDSMDDKAKWDHPQRDYLGKNIFHEMLPQIVATLDGTRFYWPSSPYGGNDHNDERQGDRHNWQVWHGEVLSRRFGEPPIYNAEVENINYWNYLKDSARFISEFGIQSYPCLETLRQVIPECALRIGSPEISYRRKDFPADKGDMLINYHMGSPATLDRHILCSMMVQAEGLKVAIEHYRSRKFHCSGTLFWQLNDCWPGISWSVLDYNLRPKASYYAVRRAYSPILCAFDEVQDQAITISVVNDTLHELSDTVIVQMMEFSGKIYYEDSIAYQCPVNSVCKICELPSSWFANMPLERVFISVQSEKGYFERNRYFLRDYRWWQRRAPKLEFSLIKQEDGNRLRLYSDAFAYAVYIDFADERVRPTDNFFDIFPNEVKEVPIHRFYPGDLESTTFTIGCL